MVIEFLSPFGCFGIGLFIKLLGRMVEDCSNQGM